MPLEKQERVSGEKGQGRRPKVEQRLRRVRPISLMADDAAGRVVDRDVEVIRHTVINTVLHDMREDCPGEMGEALEWLIPRVNARPGTTWVVARNLARFEAMQRFSRLGPAMNAWLVAVRLRAFAAVLDRVSDRLLVDIGWIRSTLARGVPVLEIKAELIRRHKSLLFNEIRTIWPMLERYYYQGESEDPQNRPTRGEFEHGSSAAVREHDKAHRISPLRDCVTDGFPLPEGSDQVFRAAPLNPRKGAGKVPACR